MTDTEAANVLQSPSIMRRKVDQHVTTLLAEERAQRIVTTGRLEQMEKDLQRVERRLAESFAHVERLAEQTRALCDRFARHADLEEEQWRVVNKANDCLETLGKSLQAHLTESAALVGRVSGLERVVYGVAGAVVSLLVAATPALLAWWLK